VFWEKYRDTAWMCRNGIRKAEAQLELTLVREKINDNKNNGFYRYVVQKRKTEENVLSPSK